MSLLSHSMDNLEIYNSIFMIETVLTPSTSRILETMDKAQRYNLRHLTQPVQCMNLENQLPWRLIMCSLPYLWVPLKGFGSKTEKLQLVSPFNKAKRKM